MTNLPTSSSICTPALTATNTYTWPGAVEARQQECGCRQEHFVLVTSYALIFPLRNTGLTYHVNSAFIQFLSKFTFKCQVLGLLQISPKHLDERSVYSIDYATGHLYWKIHYKFRINESQEVTLVPFLIPSHPEDGPTLESLPCLPGYKRPETEVEWQIRSD